MSDISERRRTDEALRQSEERYRGFISQSFEGIYRTEFDHPIDITLPVEIQIDLIYENAYMAECNQALAGMYNIPSINDFIGVRLIDAHGGKDNPVNRAAFRKLIENGYRSSNDETFEYTADGKPIWFLSNTVGVVENGHLVRLWGQTVDITARKQAEGTLQRTLDELEQRVVERTQELQVEIIEHKQAEEALLESEARYRWLADYAPDIIFRYDISPTMKLAYINPAVQAITGYTPEDCYADPLLMLNMIHPDDMNLLADYMQSLIPPSEPVIWRWIGKDGTIRWMESRIVPIHDADGQLVCVEGITRDITTRKRLEDEIAAAKERLEMVVTSSTVMLYSSQAYGDFDATYISDNIGAITGYTRQDFLSKGFWASHIHPEDAPKVFETLPKLFEQNRHTHEYRFLFKDGAYHWMYDELKLTCDESGNPLEIIGTWADITERKQAELKIKNSEERLNNIISGAADGFISVDENQNIILINAVAEKMFGYEADSLIGKNLNALIPRHHHEAHPQHIAAYGKSGESYRAMLGFTTVAGLRANGEEFPIESSISQAQSAEGKIYSVIIRDITVRKQVEDALKSANEQLNLRIIDVEKLQTELREQALHDPLTGLYNRRHLTEATALEIVRAKREHDPLSIIISDIDLFKVINDTYGHQVGDQFLMEVASLMKKHARGSDIVCRYGGEEFLLVLPGTTLDAAEKRAEELRQKCAEIIIQHEGKDLKVTMSFGVATYPDHGKAAEEIIIKADKALYQSKHSGRNRVTVWEDDDAALMKKLKNRD